MADDDKTYLLEIGNGDREAFVLCLALGTLEAMRGGLWPLTAGIWTLARPIFWEPLAEIDAKAVEVLQTADELSAIAKVVGQPAADAELDRMIGVVRARLAALPEKTWYAQWPDEADE